MKYETKTVGLPGGVAPDWEAIKASGQPRLVAHQSPYPGFFDTCSTLTEQGHLSVYVEHDDRSYTSDNGGVVVHTVWNTLVGAESWLNFLQSNPYIESAEIIERPDL